MRLLLLYFLYGLLDGVAYVHLEFVDLLVNAGNVVVELGRVGAGLGCFGIVRGHCFWIILNLRIKGGFG